MFGPTQKYRRLTHDSSGVPLYWHAHPSGYPMRGAEKPALSPAEIDSAELIYHPGYARYILPDEQDKYLKMADQAVNGVIHVTDLKVFPDPKDPGRVYMHVWWFAPEAVQPEGPHGRPPSVSPRRANRPAYIPPPWSG